MVRIASTPHPQLELNIPFMPDPDRHLQEDLLDQDLPSDDWELHESANGWYARHPEAGQTPDVDTPEQASKEAQDLHRDWIENRATHDTDGEISNSESGDSTAPQDPAQDSMIMGGTDTDDADTNAPVEVLDEDKGDYVTVTPELRAKAQHAVEQIQAGILVTAYWIARVYDEGLHVGLGYNSKKQFVENHLPFGERQARRYAKIGRRMGKFLPGASAEQLPAPDDVEDGEVPENLQGLSMGKLHELTKLDDEDLQDYVEDGEWVAPDGTRFTREDVLDMARTELGDVVTEKAQRLKETAEKEKEKRQDFEELAAKRKEERDALQDKLEEKEDQIEAAEDLERRLGPTASKLQEKRKTLNEVQEHLDEAIRLAGQIGITPEDPEADQQNLQRLLQRAQTLKDLLHEDYAEVLINMGV